MKRRNKTIFKVTNDKRPDNNDIFELNDFRITISKGTTGIEMAYALIALLNVVYEHENAENNEFTVDSFMNYLTMLMKDTRIGIAKEVADD